MLLLHNLYVIKLLRSATLHYIQPVHQEDLTLAKIETKAATEAIDIFHTCTAALKFFGAGNELIRY